MSLEERETLVNISEETGLATIDTTIQRDITKCLNRGWKITAITYRKSAVDENEARQKIMERYERLHRGKSVEIIQIRQI